jgi:phosphoglycerate dehydrogenase-like enzyme
LSDPKRKILIHFPLDFVDEFKDDFPEVEFISVPRKGDLDPGVEGEALLTYAWGTENIGRVVERGVRWVHTIGTGVDRFPMDQIGDRILTCARGANAIPIAEWTFAMMLAFEKQLPDRWLERVPERWNWAELGGLYGKSLGLIGLGTIAQAVATRAQAFGMEVRAFRRSEAKSPVPGVEIVGDLLTLCEASDHIVIAVPATPATSRLVDAAVLERVKPGAHLVNIARGSILDQDALRDALDRGPLAMASLDVCEPEPLPEGHWLYGHPKVRLSPHISWSMPGSIDAIRSTFAGNLRRFLDGEELESRVDRERGY